MEWNYLWVKHEEYRDRVRRLEESASAEEEISPQLPDSVRFTVAGFVIGMGIAAVVSLGGRSGLENAPLEQPAGMNSLTRQQSEPSDADRRAPASVTDESAAKKKHDLKTGRARHKPER